MHCTSARELWVAAKELTSASVISRVLVLKGELQQTKKQSLKMEDYLAKMKHISDQLNLVGAPVGPIDLIMHTLNGLDGNYNAVVTLLVNSPNLT